MIKTWIFKLGAIACMATSASCSSDDDKPVAPSFPEKQILEIAAGETHILQFQTDHEWRITSNKSWVRFLMNDQGQELPVAYGEAGTNSVTILMKEAGWAFEDEAALLSLTMENHTQPIFELKRPAKERVVKMTVKYHTAQPALKEQVDIAYADRTRYQIGFEANFDWKIISHPKWLREIETITGEANGPIAKLERISIENDWIPYEFADAADSDNAIIISDCSGEHTYTFPFTYTGLPDDVMNISPATILNNGVSFYYDRRLMGNSVSGIEGPTSDYQAFINDINTRNKEYTLKVVAYDAIQKAAAEIAPSEAWFQYAATPDSDNLYAISLRGEADYEAWEDRNLYLYILPMKYSSGYDYAADFDDSGQLDRLKNKYAIKISQHGKRLKGYVLKNSGTQALLTPPTPVDDPALETQYGTANIYEKAFTEDEWNARGSIQIQANGLWMLDGMLEEWTLWLKSPLTISGNKLSLPSRKAFDELPADKISPIIFKDQTDAIYGVLFIKKQL